MDVTKLRMKIGPHEFEAEGPRESVAAHFEAWKQLIAGRPVTEITVEPAAPRQQTAPPAGTAAGQQTGGASTPRDIFAVDTARKRITLRVSPAGKAQDADAALLILYGYHLCFGDDGQAVLVTRLKEALAASGHPRSRIDRTLARHVTARLLRKTGHRKGSTYQLTKTGYQRAEEMARALRAPFQSST
jgi:hypothetical protein